MDACAQPAKVKEIASKRPNTVAISAQTGEGIDQLLEVIEDQLSKQLTDVHCLVPYSKVNSSWLCNQNNPACCLYQNFWRWSRSNPKTRALAKQKIAKPRSFHLSNVGSFKKFVSPLSLPLSGLKVRLAHKN